jgi:tripartite-type tricarboxylate transporter receptor subunit TctC
MRLTRRHLAAAGLLALAFGSAHAQDKYPTRPVTIIVPQAAGGANDAIARVVAQKLTEAMGQQFIVDNKPGAGGCSR